MNSPTPRTASSINSRKPNGRNPNAFHPSPNPSESGGEAPNAPQLSTGGSNDQLRPISDAGAAPYRTIDLDLSRRPLELSAGVHSAGEQMRNAAAVSSAANVQILKRDKHMNWRRMVLAGLSIRQEIADAIGAGQRPAAMSTDEESVYDFASEPGENR